MLTHEQVERKARKYAGQSLTVGERDDVSALLAERYIRGFMQGYSCAGGILSAAEAEDMAASQFGQLFGSTAVCCPKCSCVWNVPDQLHGDPRFDCPRCAATESPAEPEEK